VEDRGTRAADTEGLTPEEARARGLEAGRGFQGDPLDDPDSPLSERIIYFAFDAAEVTAEYRPIVEAHAVYLAENPGASVTLEGHTDERGSREYNLGLGERRAQAVSRRLTLLGARPEQIRTVSYGEERPAREGHDESAWQLNRRVEIRYRSR
jgi:peptidoglycan-associated lipoprotein